MSEHGEGCRLLLVTVRIVSPSKPSKVPEDHVCSKWILCGPTLTSSCLAKLLYWTCYLIVFAVFAIDPFGEWGSKTPLDVRLLSAFALAIFVSAPIFILVVWVIALAITIKDG